jgi:hypothetical protein
MVITCKLGFLVAQVSYSNYNEVLLTFQQATYRHMLPLELSENHEV